MDVIMDFKVKISRGIFILSLVVLFGVAAFGATILISTNTSATDINGNSQSVFKDITKAIAPIKTPINVLLLAESGGNTDTIMVIHFDPVTCETSIISVLRDTKVVINGGVRKINAAYAIGGVGEATKVVSKLLGISLDYYVYIDTSMTRNIVNALGGAYYDVPCRMKYTALSQNLHIDLQKGYQLLNGDQVEQLVRFRHPNAKPGHNLMVSDYAECPQYLTSDVQRAKTQQSFLVALIKQKANPQYISKISDIMSIVFDNIKTDFKLNTLLRMMYNIEKIDPSKITTYSVYSINDNYTGTLKDNTHDILLNKTETLNIVDTIFKSDGILYNSSVADSGNFNLQILPNSGSSLGTPRPHSTVKPTLKPIPIPKVNPKKTPKPANNNIPRPAISPNPATSPPVQTDSPPTQSPIDIPTPTDLPS